MPETVLELQPIPHKSRFTSSNARIMALRKWELRRAAEKAATGTESDAAPEATPEPDTFQVKTLLRVREQLSESLSLLRSETDPASRDRLAGSITKLEEVERRLSDRRLPAIARTVDKPGSSSSRSAALLLSKPSAVPVQRQEQE